MSIERLKIFGSVPVYLLDEHHEAFIAWWLHFKQISLPHSLTLIHIDEHADFGLPHLTLPIPTLFENLNKVELFVYKQLTIGTFLIPSAAAHFFSNLIWIRPSKELTEEAKEIHLGVSGSAPFLSFTSSGVDNASFQYSALTWDKAASNLEEWMLDICLDSFLCNEKLTPEPFLLEITPAQFRLINKNNLNVWNMRYGSAARVLKRSKAYFFELDLSNWSSKEFIDNSIHVDQRLNNLIMFLSKIERVPSVVTVSRSVMSGYVPRDQVEILENRVIAILMAAFNS